MGLAGMAPDLDVLIRSSEDPLVYLEFHRQFTHSLAFIPIGGFICALVFYLIFKSWRDDFKGLYLYSVMGYGTHGLLDACTSYGTQLFWPFSSIRISWDTISIIDPIFTLPLIVCVGLTLWKKQKRFAIVGMILGSLYLSFGFFQLQRALHAGRDLAHQRGHIISNIEAKPSFANLLVFKTIYETDDKYYVDAVRLGLNEKIYPGDSILKFDKDRDLPQLDEESTSRKDIERFRWFSQGFIALHPHLENHVIDVRYSMLPNQIEPLWGVQVFPDQPRKHVDFVFYERNPKRQLNPLKAMLLGDDL
ncbi:MAG: metal-dependent hydrolase [Bdellovibrionales bacterium]